MTDPVGVYATSASVIAVGGQAVTLMYGPILGGLIVNPADATDQGISLVEVLYVDLFGPAGTATSATTVAVQPGQSYAVPPTTGNVSVNAATSGHRFSAITYQPYTPPTPAEIIGTENPCLQDVIPSYLYQQYANDDDLQAFVAAFNTLAQEYVTWLNEVNLPVYTGPMIIGDLLDWVALGLYGVRRPVLSAGNAQVFGPFNTFVGNALPFNGFRIVGPAIYTPVSDDIFKRVLTWKLYKGDGKQIDIRWLKRRVMRFLIGADGSDPNVADTQQISVTFGGNPIEITVITEEDTSTVSGMTLNSGPFNDGVFNQSNSGVRVEQTVTTYEHDNQVNINLLSQIVTRIRGATFNSFVGNAVPFNDYAPAEVEHFSPLPNVEVFKQAVDQGVLDMPFQFKTVVNIR